MPIRGRGTWLSALVLAGLLAPGSLPAVQQQNQSGNAGPVPAQLNLEVTRGQTGSTVAWRPVPGAARYVVHRWKRQGNQSRCCEVHVPVGTALQWVDPDVLEPGAYFYRVVAHLPGGARRFQERLFQVPGQTAPAGQANPRNFAAAQTGEGVVLLTWSKPTGSTFFRLTGPGTGAEGTLVTTNRYTASGVPPGRQEWQLIAYYPQGGTGDPANPSRAVLVVSGPQHPAPVATADPTEPERRSPDNAIARLDVQHPDLPQRMTPGGGAAAPVDPPAGTVPTDQPPIVSTTPAPTAPPPGQTVSMPDRRNRVDIPLQPVPAPEAPPSGAAPAPASGRYLVTAVGMYAGSVTTDNLFHEDGRGDEVYAAAFVRRYDRQTASVLETVRRQTRVYGDVHGRVAERSQAGRLSPTGGIGNGDPIPLDPAVVRAVPAQEQVFPWKIWEGTLTEGADAVVITPSVWEYDGRPALFEMWLSNQASLTNTLFVSRRLQEQIDGRVFTTVELGATEASEPRWQRDARINAPALISVALGFPPVFNLEGQDRPVGWVPGPSLPNRTIVLTREIIEAALARPPQGALVPYQGVVIPLPRPGMLVVNFEDRFTPNLTDRKAQYSMVLQVERLP